MKNLFLILLALVSLQIVAQTPDTLSPKQDTIKMILEDGTTVIILTDDVRKAQQLDLNGIMGSLSQEIHVITLQYERDQKKLDSAYEAGAMDRETYMEEKEELNEIYVEKIERIADQIEDEGERESDAWEAWAEQWEADIERHQEEGKQGVPPPPPFPNSESPSDKESWDRILEDEDDFDWDERRNNQARTLTQGDIHFGLNQLFEENTFNMIDGNGDLNDWSSTYFNIGFAGKTRIGKPTSKFYIRYGVLWSWNVFRLKGANVIQKSIDTLSGDPTTIFGTDSMYANVAKTKFSMSYFEFPVMFQLDLSEKGMDNAFNIGVGGYAGVRLYSKRTIHFDDPFNEPSKEELNNDFNMPRWRYGLMAQVGFGAFKITGKYDIGYLFEESVAPNYNIGSITIGFAW